MVEFVDSSLLDLIKFTMFLHVVNPMHKDKFVSAIEEYNVGDKNVVFHMTSKDPKQNAEKSVVILSAEYITEHPYWDNNTEMKNG